MISIQPHWNKKFFPFHGIVLTWWGRNDVYSVRLNMDNDEKWFPFWCDSQRFVFLTSKLLGLHVWVSSIHYHKIIFFASIRVLTESQYTEWSKSYDWCRSRTYIVRCTMCVLMVTWVWSEISFHPEENQLCFIEYLTTASVAVDTFHIKY
jgi:hypothetical protein